MGGEGELLGEVAHCLGLLADPTRLRLLSCLCGAERPVDEVMKAVGLQAGPTFPVT
jgi:ArsR family transcriptional regulator